jgi:hypothetical protein
MRLDFLATRHRTALNGRHEEKQVSRLYCQQHDGLFVSNPDTGWMWLDSPRTSPHSLILRKQRRAVHAAACHLQAQPALNRRDPAWLSKMPIHTRHYLYLIHLSDYLLITPTLDRLVPVHPARGKGPSVRADDRCLRSRETLVSYGQRAHETATQVLRNKDWLCVKITTYAPIKMANSTRSSGGLTFGMRTQIQWRGDGAGCAVPGGVYRWRPWRTSTRMC